MAAVFPLDTTKPWTFNGVTYEYDATENRWFVTSTNKSDFVDDSLNDLTRDVNDINSTIEQEIETRTDLLQDAASKNNDQDASIAALEQRVDALGAVVGALEFKGRYKYAIEHTSEACDAAYGRCLIEAESAEDTDGARIQCNRLYTDCSALVGQPYEEGTFTSKGTTNVMPDVEEFVFSGTDLDGQVFDWINVVEPEDYIEFVEVNNGDTSLYECIEEPKVYSTERSIRVKYLKQTGTGDGNFNLQEEYEIRVIKASTGIDIIEADNRYVTKPYTVHFSSTAPSEGEAEDKTLRNGELWYDTLNLELFVWNNNAWVSTAKPPSQEIVIADAVAQIDSLTEQTYVINQTLNTLTTELQSENNIYYSDDAPTGDISGILRNGDIWIDSSNLNIKFYSGGAWVNPDRQNSSVDLTPYQKIVSPQGRKFKKADATNPTTSGTFTYYESSGQLKLALNRRDVEGVKWLDIDFNDSLAAPVLFRIVQWANNTTHKTIRYGAIDKIVASEGGNVVCDVKYHATNGSLANGSNYFIIIGGLI